MDSSPFNVYMDTYWPWLKSAVDKILFVPTGHQMPLSFEEISSLVFKCTKDGFAECLYKDLLSHIASHLEGVKDRISQTPDGVSYINAFYNEMMHYCRSTAVVASVFLHLNNIYVTSKRNTTLVKEFNRLFSVHVLECQANHLICLLDDLRRKPFTIQPNVTQEIVTKLHEINPDCSEIRPNLFSFYIPNFDPPCNIEHLEHYVLEATMTLRDLRTHPSFISGDQSRKRHKSDEQTEYSNNSSSMTGSQEDHMR